MNPQPVPKDPAAALNDYQVNHRSPIDNRQLTIDNRQSPNGPRKVGTHMRQKGWSESAVALMVVYTDEGGWTLRVKRVY